MELTINDTTLQVSNEGTTIIIKAERGEYREDVWTREPKEEELPEMLHDAMCPVYNGSVAPTFEEWSYLWGSAEEDEDDSEDRADFEVDHKAWEGWKKVSDINPADVLNKLEEIYGDF